MNIQQAKEEIRNTIRAYLAKDEFGNYLIPSIRQRPILLMGPPGVGKTQIMRQLAAETGVGLVDYTITHHTRQSAVGLPFLAQRTYGGEAVTVTDYTMSEILAACYDLMEKTGLREGILFLDEINCVSETLAPMMLQFLQCKTFGNRALPEGWIIAAAGNPPEYNKSVRDFDVVTLDRVRRIDVEADFSVWKTYARARGLHGAVVSYLDIRRENFYRMEPSADGLQFATARGWEDLSELLFVYEKLGIPVTAEVVGQYIQLPRAARDFTAYLALYNKYQRAYHVDDILAGKPSPSAAAELRAAPFDERLSVLGLLLSRLGTAASAARRQDALAESLHAALTAVRDRSAAGEDSAAVLAEQTRDARDALRRAKEAGQLDERARDAHTRLLAALEAAGRRTADVPAEKMLDVLRSVMGEAAGRRAELGAAAGAEFDRAFRFLEEALGECQELVIFVTELTAGADTSWFVETFGCDAYFRHNRELFFDETRSRIAGEIETARRAEQSGDGGQA